MKYKGLIIGSVVLTALVVFGFSISHPSPSPIRLSFLENIASEEGIPEINANQIALDPYKRNALAAEIHLSKAIQGTVSIRVHALNATGTDLVYSINSNRKAIETLPIWGLYENTENTVDITFYNSHSVARGSRTVIIKTDSFPNPTEGYTFSKEGIAPHFLFEVSGEMLDEQGNFRWFFNANDNEDELYPLSNGIVAVVSKDHSEITLFSVVGKELARYNIPHGEHHEVTEKTPGGNLLIATNHADGKFFDAIIEIDRATGDVVKEWDLRNYFDESRPTLDRYTPEAWLHLNSIKYDATDNTLLISARSQNFVAKIGYNDGVVHWILGNHEGWSGAYLPYLLQPVNFNTTRNINQDWTYLQHDASITPNGNVLIFDNGGGRPGFGNDGSVFGEKAVGGSVRIVEYTVDAKKKTVEKTFEYSDFPEKSSIKKGSVSYINPDYLLIGYGEFNRVTVVKKSTAEKVLDVNLGDGEFYRAYPINWSTVVE